MYRRSSSEGVRPAAMALMPSSWASTGQLRLTTAQGKRTSPSRRQCVVPLPQFVYIVRVRAGFVPASRRALLHIAGSINVPLWTSSKLARKTGPWIDRDKQAGKYHDHGFLFDHAGHLTTIDVNLPEQSQAVVRIPAAMALMDQGSSLAHSSTRMEPTGLCRTMESF